MPRVLGEHAASRIMRVAFIALVCVQAVSAGAADWPAWRCDASRRAVTAETLPAELHLQWVRELPKLEPAWLDEPRMRFDVAYEPIVVDGTLFFASPRSDTVTALDAATGERRWRFVAGGPIRFAPLHWRGRLFLACDDGKLYCIRAADASVQWTFRAGPSTRRVLGNKRLISTWPVRGAPVVADGTVYFAAGVWPFMGVFVYALDAQTGQVRWVNDGQGAEYTDQPHGGAYAFGSVAPQGYMAVSGDRLIVPNGRSTPAVFDRHSGSMVYFHMAENKYIGDFAVSATSDLYFNSGHVYPLETGTPFCALGPAPVHTEEVAYAVEDGEIVARSLADAGLEQFEDDEGNARTRLVVPEAWRSPIDAGRVHAMAGDMLICSGEETVSAVEVRPQERGAVEVWSAEVADGPSTVAVADGRLFVGTLGGRLLCYGPGEAEVRRHAAGGAPPPPEDAWTERAAEILRRTGVTEGYCLCLGVETGRLMEELVRQSQMHVIGVDADPETVERVRRRALAQGIHGARLAVIEADPATAELPPWVASLIVSEDPSDVAGADGGDVGETLFGPMRPYGGTACVELSAERHERLVARVDAGELPGAEVERAGAWTLLRRPGALDGAGTWTHQYGDPANTVVSTDSVVRAPLGMLWFGGSSNVHILPRHGHGPPEQVIGGRLFIEGPNGLRAQDVYTGRVLWRRELPGFGRAYDNTSHQPGANALGSNYSSAADGVYVVWDGRCLRLDPATGETISEFTLPPAPGEDEPQGWGFVSVYRDLLIAGASPVIFEGEAPIGRGENWDATSSASIVALDRHSGEILWSFDSRLAFRHNAICVADERLFCIDRVSDTVAARMKRRGGAPEFEPRLTALDVRTGEVLWSTTENVFGTWLSCSIEHGLLLQAGRPSRDMLPDEPGDRMIVYRAADGAVVWDRPHHYGGPPLLHGDTIITQGQAFNLLDGERITRRHPMTGAEIPWTWERTYGCNTAIASEWLLTFRSGAAGFYDLATDGGTGNIGGFKSGCTSNLVVADGVLNAPDYTRTCICSYQNQTSLGLVHDPSVEVWTFSALPQAEEAIIRLGLNLSAPGDRMADNGTLWLDYPSTGGRSPDPEVVAEGEGLRWFRRHSSVVEGGAHGWIGASGAEGLARLSVRLAESGAEDRAYVVRLYFCEPRDLGPGERLFDVAVQGTRVLRDFDIAREAGGSARVIVREAHGVMAGGELTVTLHAAEGSQPPVLCGVEAVAAEAAERSADSRRAAR